jgi:hypothetical protein
LTKNTWIPAGVGQTFLWNINELNKINKKLKPLQAEDEEE